MPENTRIEDYILYIAYLEQKLSKFFEAQKPYIFCKKGCSKCCQNGEYPFSKSEFDFLKIGFSKLPKELQDEILAKAKKIRSEKTGKGYTYECPFLFNNECSVYEFRGIICRSFGLMSINPKGLSKVPFCAFEGLNYSNVVEPDTKIISEEKDKIVKEREKISTSKNIEENFNITFGEKKPLIDWIDV